MNSINVLNSNFERIAIVDDYTSLMWCKRYYEIGAVDLEVEASVENLKLFRKHFYITREDDDAIFRIEAIEIDTDENGDDKLIIGAVDCKAILNQRITWEQSFVRNSPVEGLITDMLNANVINPENQVRKIPNFITDIQTVTGELTTRQSTYDEIGNKIIELCLENKLGWKITLNQNKQFVFKTYKGVDRSILQDEVPRLIFSHEFENLFSSKYQFDSTEYKNVALIGGQGEGLDRILADIGDSEGLERREMFVDASKANSEGGDAVDYRNALISEGKEKLAETAATTSFEGEVDFNSYQYKTDYDLGDIVTITNKYGITASVRIVEIIETWDNEGYTIEPVFEYAEEEINLNNVLLTEDDEVLMTERSIPLLYETAPFITEDGQNIVME